MNDTPPNRPPDPAAERARRRSARRAALGRKIDTSVASPCISVCQIDDATGECLGCRRTIDEIRDWIIMTAAEKTAVIAQLETREAQAESGPAKR